MRKFWLVIALFIFSFSTVHATVWINEISPSTEIEWIELYNEGSASENLTGWTLVDDNDLNDDITLNISIDPGQYFVATNSAKKSWLNNSGDIVTLYDLSKNIIDKHVYTTIASDKTTYRSPNGSENWVIGSSTQGVTNPTPVPSPTPTPTPTPSPSPISIPTPTPSPSLAPSPTPTTKPSLKPSPSQSPVLTLPPDGTVAGESTEIDLSVFGVSPSPSLQGVSLKAPTINKSRVKTVLLIGSGLVLVALASFFGYRRYLATIKK